VFGSIGRRGWNVGAVSARGRRFCAALAILSLYVQLLAAGLCTAGSPADALANQGAFPICHTPGGGSPPAQDQAHHDCPFCALHCKAAMVVSPSIGVPERFVAVVHAELAFFLVPAPARFSLGAQPRGPPASA
jgi:hypothetical protein